MIVYPYYIFYQLEETSEVLKFSELWMNIFSYFYNSGDEG